jgi:hypothetical protein
MPAVDCILLLGDIDVEEPTVVESHEGPAQMTLVAVNEANKAIAKKARGNRRDWARTAVGHGDCQLQAMVERDLIGVGGNVALRCGQPPDPEDSATH